MTAQTVIRSRRAVVDGRERGVDVCDGRITAVERYGAVVVFDVHVNEPGRTDSETAARGRLPRSSSHKNVSSHKTPCRHTPAGPSPVSSARPGSTAHRSTLLPRPRAAA